MLIDSIKLTVAEYSAKAQPVVYEKTALVKSKAGLVLGNAAIYAARGVGTTLGVARGIIAGLRR